MTKKHTGSRGSSEVLARASIIYDRLCKSDATRAELIDAVRAALGETAYGAAPEDSLRHDLNWLERLGFTVEMTAGHRYRLARFDPKFPLLLTREHVTTLAADIARNGLLHPITVRRAATGYELLAGLHRFLAIQRLHWTHVDALILDARDDQAQEITLTENLRRKQISPVEEAIALAQLLELEPSGIDALAAKLNLTPNGILDRLDMLNYPDYLLDLIHRRKVSQAAAKHLAKITPDDLRRQRCNEAAQWGITARTAALWLQDATSAPPSHTQLSQISCAQADTQPQTRTQIKCNVCQAFVDVERTKAARLCDECIEQIQLAQRRPPLHEPTGMQGPYNPPPLNPAHSPGP